MNLSTDEALRKGIECQKAGQADEAARIYGIILQEEPDNSDVSYNLGVLALNKNNLEDAINYFKAALKNNPSVGKFWIAYIGILISAGDFDEAANVLNQLKKKGVEGDAIEEFELLVEKKTGSINPQTESLYKKLSYGNSAYAAFYQGNKEYSLGRLDAALENYKKAIRVKADFPDAYLNKGAILKEKKEFDQAIESFQEAIRLRPDFPEAITNQGHIYFGRGDYEKARDKYQKAVELNYRLAKVGYSLSLQKLGHYKEAIEVLVLRVS